MKQSVGIIGGGITGLTLARDLYRRGIYFRLYDKGETVGGVMQSRRQDDWLAEAGPNTFLVKSPAVESFLQQTSLTEKRIFASDTAQKRYIVRDGTLHPLPSGPLSFLTSGLFSTTAKLRLLKEPFVGRLPAGQDESVASFVRRRLGTEFLDYGINPFVAGIYAGDPEKLSLLHTFKRMHDLEQQYGSLFWGQFRGRGKRKKRDQNLPDDNRIFSFPDGIGQLPAELARPISDHLELNTEITAIRKTKGGSWSISGWRDRTSFQAHHEQLICTIPLYRLSNLSVDIDESDHLNTLKQVNYPPVSVWTLGVRRSDVGHPLDGFGMLIPEVEQRTILGTLFSSACFPGRAPENGATLTTFLGGARQPEIARKPEEEQRRIILEELGQLLNLNGDPVFEHAVHWKHAIPQYELGYEKVKESIERLESANDGLHLAGSFRSGASINDCMRNALSLAEQLADT